MEENEIAIESDEEASPAADGRLDANAQRIRTSGLVLLLAVVLTGAWALPQHWDVYGVIGFGLITLRRAGRPSHWCTDQDRAG